MSSVKIAVSWSGKKFDLDIDPEESLEVLRTLLFSLTGVENERQKLLFKGKLLTGNDSLNGLGINEGSKLMMMGTPGELPKEPEEKTLFLEDMSEKEQAEALKIPSGLENLGNTCYLNSTLQCLRVIPELQESLNSYTGGLSDSDAQRGLTASLRDLYHQLNQTNQGYRPEMFLRGLRVAFPQFDQRNAYGYMQQDAEECWSQIISSLKHTNILVPKQSSNASSDDGTPSSSAEESFINCYMRGEFTTTLKCTHKDALEEKEEVKKEEFYKLNCHITVHVDYVQTGIIQALDEQIEKNSPTLGRTATYSKTSRISRLPSYLTVQFVRFYWKASTSVKTKVLRKVKFPMEFDVTEFCTDELKNKILPLKNRIIELEKEKSSKKKKGLAKSSDGQEDPSDSQNDEANIEELKKLIDPDLAKDTGSNVSGLYDLCAVLTHAGRSADSGHYIGWVRKDNSDDWLKYDDDRVSLVPQEDIQKLEGGGDWHMAYILLYRSKKIA